MSEQQREQIILGDYQFVGISKPNDVFVIHYIKRQSDGGMGVAFNGGEDIKSDLTMHLNVTLRNRWMAAGEEFGDYEFISGMNLDDPRETILAFFMNYLIRLYFDGRGYAEEITVGESDPDEKMLEELDLTKEEYHEIMEHIANEECALSAIDRHNHTMKWLALQLKASSLGVSVLNKMDSTILHVFQQAAEEEAIQ